MPNTLLQEKKSNKFSQNEIIKLVFFSALTLGTCLIFVLTPTLLPSTLISFVLFFIFSPLIDGFERKGISRSTSIITVFLLCGLVLSWVTSWMIPRISHEVQSLQKGKASYVYTIGERFKAQEKKIFGTSPFFNNLNLTDKAIQWIQTSEEKIWAFASQFASNILVGLFLVPFLTFVLLKDAYEIKRQVLKLVPNRYFEMVYSLTSRTLDKMGGYVSARILESFLVTLLIALGCAFTGIPYAILLGLFAGATNPIPYIGPVIGMVPGLAIVLFDPTYASLIWAALLVYGIAHLIDMFILFPLVVGKIVDLHPVLVVVCVVLGAQLFGILGMIIAVPITSMIKIFVEEIYSRIYSSSS